MEISYSIRGIPIRLTSERWVHIIENHDDLAGRMYEALEAIADPDLIPGGVSGELLAVRSTKRKVLVVVYREVSSSDGFIITAFQTSKVSQLLKTRTIIWRKLQSRKS